MSGIRLSIRVWDLPIRLFHWAIVGLLAIAYVSQLEFWMQLHYLAGYAALILLIFRLVWGFVGSDTALFRNFLKGPALAWRHLAQFRRREADNEIGHNAAGGWMVLLLLLLLAIECVSGLFTRDDEVAEGPFAHHLPGAATDIASEIHAICWTLIWITVALHVSAILAYRLVKGQNLLRPMITGKKRLAAATRPPRMASGGLALLILAAAAALVAVALTVF